MRYILIVTLVLLGGCAALDQPASHTSRQWAEDKARCKAPNWWDERWKECKSRDIYL